jgi:hypothetical protein
MWVDVKIWDASGNYLFWTETNRNGDYTARGLPAGDFYATTSNRLGYVDELYSALPCPGGESCDVVTSGTPIAVTLGSETSGNDFALAQGGTISGTLTHATSGAKLGNVEVHVRDASGNTLDHDLADVTGGYTLGGLPTGSYYVTTWNRTGFLDELYDDVPCPGGGETCDLTAGAGISVTQGADTPGKDLALKVLLFYGSFESGDAEDWSTAAP